MLSKQITQVTAAPGTGTHILYRVADFATLARSCRTSNLARHREPIPLPSNLDEARRMSSSFKKRFGGSGLRRAMIGSAERLDHHIRDQPSDEEDADDCEATVAKLSLRSPMAGPLAPLEFRLDHVEGEFDRREQKCDPINDHGQRAELASFSRPALFPAADRLQLFRLVVKPGN